jgi:uncharacterized protein (TIGR04141 family)
MATRGQARTRTLTIYLLKQGHTAKSCLRDVDHQRKFDVDVGEGGTGELYLKTSPPTPPRWVSFFSGAIQPKLPSLFGTAVSAVLLIERKDRLFALTFGYGRHMLVPGTFEENFGLVVTLNSIPRDKIRSMDLKSFDALLRHTRTQASREGTLRDFGMDVEQDLLRAVTGTPTDSAIGRRLTGMDALQVAVAIDIAGLTGLLDRCHEKYKDQSYKTNYPGIDQIAEVRDPGRTVNLDEKLVELIQRKEFERLWLAAPEILDWSQVDGFLYQGEPDDEEPHPDLHVAEFVNTLRDVTALTASSLRSRRVRCVPISGGNPIDTWTAYQCIYCEIDEGGETFLLSGGKWYRVEKSFVSQVNAAVKKISAAGYSLPAYDTSRDTCERDYNERVARGDPSNFALMDGDLIAFGGGKSTVEFCDLFTKAKCMIHVKRYAGSSALSHLFSQGEMAATLFLTEQEFREKVITKLPPTHRRLVPKNRPGSDEFEVVFGVVSRSQKPIETALPFFSRLNLRNRARTLGGLGCKVRLVKVSVE